MALNIISNYAANVAHRNLSASDEMATRSLSKLSSGTRVVSARDDAASMAIGARLNATTQALKTATVNVGQANSMLQIADGGMATIDDVLVRMKTLAVQASSGNLSGTERGFLNDEFDELRNEIDRIASSTNFNGIQLLG
ncbi:MAG TPA: flagellin, partial [Thalassospira sp.]|nr:flagellin [Thalassospira sp.]